jgi:hypothetical protein
MAAELGQGWFTGIWADGQLVGIRVDRADPRILISEEALRDFREHEVLCGEVDGDILRIRGVNRAVVYRIRNYLPDQRAYVLEWPD